MPLTITASRSAASAELHAFGVFSDRDLSDGIPQALAASTGFEAQVGTTLLFQTDDRLSLAVGLGAAEEFETEVLRKAGAALVSKAREHRHVATSFLADVVDEVEDVDISAAAQSLSEGLHLGSYRYAEFKSEPEEPTLNKVSVVGPATADVKAALKMGGAIASGQLLARDLVNEPGGSLTAPAFADKLVDMANESGLEANVMDLSVIQDAGLGGLLGVSRGSTNEPRFVELTYTPDGGSDSLLAFVGKGITFDAGGLSIKSGQGMMSMKMDMGGAAAVAGAMSSLADAGVAVTVKAYLPLTDNMLGGDATRPGDVLTIRNGKTIEVLNTDAEGRLVLADALSLASETDPDAIIDLATLTGACMVALGPSIAGLMSNDDEFAGRVGRAADAADERVWRLPLPDDYKKQVESPIADMKNIGGSYGGALTAGLILSEFVGEGIPWVHLDIAGPAFTENEEPGQPKGGTGFGVRTLIELARSWG